MTRNCWLPSMARRLRGKHQAWPGGWATDSTLWMGSVSLASIPALPQGRETRGFVFPCFDRLLQTHALQRPHERHSCLVRCGSQGALGQSGRDKAAVRWYGSIYTSHLGRLLGSRQRASDILTRKRSLTMRMAWKLHRERGIPAEALIAPPPTRGRRSAAQAPTRRPRDRRYCR
jgi:hypothetical protein